MIENPFKTSALTVALLLGVAVQAQNVEQVAEAPPSTVTPGSQTEARSEPALVSRYRFEALENERQALEMALLAEQSRVRALELAEQQRSRRLQQIRVMLLLALALVIAAVVLWRRGEARRDRATAASDPLTGLANREEALRVLNSLLGRLDSARGRVSIVLLAVDDLASIRDLHGSKVGGAALRTLANALSDAVRPGDVVARVDEDAFLLILPRANEKAASRVALRMLELVPELPVRGDRSTLQLGVSAGCAEAAAGQHNAETLYEAAQLALSNTPVKAGDETPVGAATAANGRSGDAFRLKVVEAE